MGPSWLYSLSSCAHPQVWQPIVDGMERHRGTALRIGDVHIAHRGPDAAMSQDALHLGQVHARLQQIGRTAMPKLMQAMDGHWRTARDRVDTVADGTARETLATAAHQQRALAAESRFFQLVVAKWQIRFETPQHHLRQWHTAFVSRLAAIDAQGSFRAIKRIEVQPLQFATAKTGAVKHRQHRYP